MTSRENKSVAIYPEGCGWVMAEEIAVKHGTNFGSS
jgi:hypothetical protein